MNEKYMKAALKEAEKAMKCGEMPVGAVVVLNNKIIGRGYNNKESKKNAIMHAEIIAIKQACRKMDDWRLNKCSIYVTMEPCLMCVGAINEARIKTIFCGVLNKQWHSINKNLLKNLKINIKYGIVEEEIKKLMKNFFILIRNR